MPPAPAPAPTQQQPQPQQRPLKVTLTEYKEAKAKAKTLPVVAVASGGGGFTKFITKDKETTTTTTAATNGVTEFWSDIYKFTTQKTHLLWNHCISNDSMVKLLQEQGTIKFNPIEYYRNTMESHEQVVKTQSDAVNIKILLHCIKAVSNLDTHALTLPFLTALGEEAGNIIETTCTLSETKKIQMMDAVKAELCEYHTTKKTDLAFKYGFKYKQHVKFLETSLSVIEEEEESDEDEDEDEAAAAAAQSAKNKKIDPYVRQWVSVKAKAAILESGGNHIDTCFNAKETAAIEKTLKKDCKMLSALPYDAKYFVRWFQYKMAHRVVEQSQSQQPQKRLAALQETLAQKVEQLEYLLRAKLYPLLNQSHAEKARALEVGFKLFEYASAKDKIVGELQLANFARDNQHDQHLLERVARHNFDEPVVQELATLIHSVILEGNKVPLMVRVLELFTRNLANKSKDKAKIPLTVLNAYIEMYTYILAYLAQNDAEYNKIAADQKKKYIAAMTLADAFFLEHQIDTYEHQMVHLYEHLAPLSHFDEKKPKLDQWQKDVFEMMDRRQNIIVIAPTSSGKTALSTYASLVFNHVLFVVPSAELARQVCGMIRNLVLDNKIKKHISLVTGKDVYHDNEASFDILVGTPDALEQYFVTRNIQTDLFDYIVFDEIHQLNQEVVGAELERWIKWLTHNTRSHFLALSACVGNAEQLHAWWRQFVPDGKVELVCCHRRFLQQQKYLWQGHLTKIHPLAVISLDFLQKKGFAHDDGTVQSDMAFTPDELYDLYAKVRAHPLFDKMLHPAEYFTSIRLTLEDCKQWEWDMKRMLQALAHHDPAFVTQLLAEYHIVEVEVEAEAEAPVQVASSNAEQLYKLLKELQGKNLLPTILFRLDPNVCQQKFTELIHYLKEEEARVYPFYYDDLQFCNEAYETSLAKEKELHKIPIPDNLDVSAQVYIEQRKQSLKNSEFALFQKNYTSRLEARIYYAKGKFTEFKHNTALAPDIVRNHLTCFKRQIRYYEKEIQRAGKMQELVPVNIYKPHPDFTFLDEYITSEHIVEYRRQLMDYIKEEKKSQEKQQQQQQQQHNKKDTVTTVEDQDKDKEKEKKKAAFRTETYVSYDHIFVMGMERGVILYLNRLPTPFQRVGQSLIAATHMKLAPVTFSDQSLALGINYPIRSVILTGGHIDPIIAHQMIGRAGRRGVDPKGYTIYYDVSWRSMMQEQYLAVRGSQSLDGAIWTIPYLWEHIRDKFDLVTRFHLKDYTSQSDTVQTLYTTFLEDMQTIHDTFQREFNNELLDHAAIATHCMLQDVYRHKHFGFQAVFIPYLLEEMSRWKPTCHKLDSSDKWVMVQVLTAFLNGEWDHASFSDNFRHKISRWPATIVRTYSKDHHYTAIRLENHDEHTHLHEYWHSLSQLLSALYSVCKDRRLNTALGNLFLDVKTRLKKYTF